MFITTEHEFHSYIESIKSEPYIAIDTEFMREKSYYPYLCLIQIASSKGIALIDPIALKTLEPLRPILADENIVKVFHAAGQDLEIFYTLFREQVSPLFDSQIAAGFIGLPGQVGYGQLVYDLLGTKIKKADSYTDWSRRPLDDSQIEYAREDVSYLYEIYPLMKEKLINENRMAWAEDEFEKISEPSRFEIDYSMLYTKIKKLNGLKPRALAVAQRMAIWRENTAQELDRPRKWVLSDEIIIEIARRAPKTAGELKRIRAFPALSSFQVNQILKEIKIGLEMDIETLPQIKKKRKLSYAEDILVDLLMVYVKDCARQNQVVPTQLALRADVEEFLMNPKKSHLSKGWRADLLGEDFSKIARGEAGLIADESGLKLITR